MDPTHKLPGPPGTPLFPASPDRVNKQRPLSTFELELPAAAGRERPERHERTGSVQDKIAALNSVAMQGKQLERKANDAALKRAMLGREEAESEMRRYREEARALRRQIEEGKDRERKVGERLESVMENYGRAKETHAHTQALWEKEIRRARKENFKSQSVVVKLQEELKTARNMAKLVQADLEEEKERGMKREQEAFAARYQLVGVQEELAQMQEKIKLVEQERDALKTIAKHEEIARIAAEGRIPLPPSPQDDEFASPKKARKSVDLATITSSAASEDELDDMRMRLQWEQQRADRAHERVEFLELECRLNCCVSRATRPVEPTGSSDQASTSLPVEASRSSTIFIPAEGVFRKISPASRGAPQDAPREIPQDASQDVPQDVPPEASREVPQDVPQGVLQEAPQDVPNERPEEVPEKVPGEAPEGAPKAPKASPWISPANNMLSPMDPPQDAQPTEPLSYARTPSCEPPALAVSLDANTSLLSLFDAPHHSVETENDNDNAIEDNEDNDDTVVRAPSPAPREPVFHTISTTTTIPLSNPDLGPTMSREEALAQIRARRGRARSLANGTLTPKKPTSGPESRRDISAPASAGRGLKSGALRGMLRA